MRGALLGLTTVMAATAFGQSADPECRCRDPQGERRDLGTVECVTIGRHEYLVRCEMSTNTPYWRRLGDGAGCSSPIT